MLVPNMNDVTDILEAFTPNRAYRRSNAGARCTMCGLGITAPDLALVTVKIGFGSTQSRPIHTQCTSLLWDLVYSLREEKDEEAV